MKSHYNDGFWLGLDHAMTTFKMIILRGSMRGPNRENIGPFYIVRVRGPKHPGPAFLACRVRLSSFSLLYSPRRSGLLSCACPLLYCSLICYPSTAPFSPSNQPIQLAFSLLSLTDSHLQPIHISSRFIPLADLDYPFSAFLASILPPLVSVYPLSVSVSVSISVSCDY
jgi:hypothetical protein